MSYKNTELHINGAATGSSVGHINFGPTIAVSMGAGGMATLNVDTTQFVSTSGGVFTGDSTLQNANVILIGTSKIDGRVPSADGAILDLINTGTGFDVRTGTNTFAKRTITGTAGQLLVTNGDGVAGNPTLSLPTRLILPGTDGLGLPVGTTAQRGTPRDGLVRFNSDLSIPELSLNATWIPLVMSNDARLSLPQVLIVSTNPAPGQFATISAALASITDASATKPYLISVGPGVFSENIVMKPYVVVNGSSSETTIISSASTTQHLVVGADKSIIENVQLTGAATGYAALYTSFVTNDATAVFNVRSVRFAGFNDTLAWSNQPSSSYSSIYLEDANLVQGATFTNGFIATGPGTARVSVRSAVGNGSPATLFKADGPLTTILCAGSFFRTTTANGTGLHVRNGGRARMVGVSMLGFNKGIWAENAGAAPDINCEGVNLQNNVLDLVIDHPGTTGHYSGSAARAKTTIDPACPITVQYLDPESTGVTLVGPLYVGPTNSQTVNVTDLITQGSTMGLIDGGGLTNLGGLTVGVAGGYGYLDAGGIAAPGTLKRFNWNATTITLPANAASYIYITNAGVLTSSTTTPEVLATCVLGRVTTEDTTIAFIENTPTQARHIGNLLNRALRQAVGPIFQRGGLLVEKENSPYSLTVTQGTYYYGGSEFNIVGGSPITFRDYYHTSITTWSHDPATVVNNTHYDANQMGLVPIPAGGYVKHALFTVGTGANERYMLVRGQQYSTELVLAEAAPLPLPPPTFGNSMALLGSIIVQAGAPKIIEIFDNRPVVGFKTPTLSAAATHANLLGLDQDDHKQYLLT
ncbi:MAG: hypothetical protein EOP83_13275, partial [Verrucomicrobiaceae bacterium]